MAYSVIQYQCKICGHTWTWGYCFVVQCRVCKTYHSFSQAAVPEGEWAAAGEPTPFDQPAEQTSTPLPSAGNPPKTPLAADRNGGYSCLETLRGCEDGFPAVG